MKTSAQIKAFRKWWKSKEAEGYQYGPGPLATVAFGFEAGWEARQAEMDAKENIARLRTMVDGDPNAHTATVIDGTTIAVVRDNEVTLRPQPKSPGEERRLLAQQRKARRAKR